MNEEKKEIRIGEATIWFNEDGSTKTTMFTPESTYFWDKKFTDQLDDTLGPVDGSKGRDGVKKAAELVFGAWFNQMNEIELADREKYEIFSEVRECEEYPNGCVKSCTILFTFRPRELKEVKSAFSTN